MEDQNRVYFHDIYKLGFIFYMYGYKPVGTLQLPKLVNPEEKNI